MIGKVVEIRWQDGKKNCAKVLNMEGSRIKLAGMDYDGHMSAGDVDWFDMKQISSFSEYKEVEL